MVDRDMCELHEKYNKHKFGVKSRLCRCGLYSPYAVSEILGDSTPEAVLAANVIFNNPDLYDRYELVRAVRNLASSNAITREQIYELTLKDDRVVIEFTSDYHLPITHRVIDSLQPSSYANSRMIASMFSLFFTENEEYRMKIFNYAFESYELFNALMPFFNKEWWNKVRGKIIHKVRDTKENANDFIYKYTVHTNNADLLSYLEFNRMDEIKAIGLMHYTNDYTTLTKLEEASYDARHTGLKENSEHRPLSSEENYNNYKQYLKEADGYRNGGYWARRNKQYCFSYLSSALHNKACRVINKYSHLGQEKLTKILDRLLVAKRKHRKLITYEFGGR